MDKHVFKSFLNYKLDVMQEEYNYSKFSKVVTVDHGERMVTYHIVNAHIDGKSPTQTELIHDCGIPHSTLRKILKKLIVMEYIIEIPSGKDHRFKHYAPTEMALEGFKIHTARHFKTLLRVATETLSKSEQQKVDIQLLTKILNSCCGSYADYKAYGDFDLNTLDEVLYQMASKKK
jgi:DNA-binding MarR family transcriptional regulator